MKRAAFELGTHRVAAGTRANIELPTTSLPTGGQLSMPVIVLHGANPGPTVWINAAIHGDEIGGVEIIRRVLRALDPKKLSGTLIAVPVVNVHGFLEGERYLPDRRDLNRSFPGAANGSLARRVAHLFMTEIVSRCSVGIDLHTGSDGRTNLPQIRADLSDPETLRLARVFGAPVMISSTVREGTLRGAGTKGGATVLLFEGGEAHRFDQTAIRTGVSGCMRVLHALEMIDNSPGAPPESRQVTHSKWVRARRSGLEALAVQLGEMVTKGQLIGTVHDAYGRRLSRTSSPMDGIVIGLELQPLVNQGDAIVHIAALTPKESS